MDLLFFVLWALAAARGLSPAAVSRLAAPGLQQLWRPGVGAPRRVGSSEIGGQSPAPCAGRRVPTRGASWAEPGRVAVDLTSGGGREGYSGKSVSRGFGQNWDVLLDFVAVHFSSVARSCLTLCDPMDRSAPGLPVHRQLMEPAQTHVHRVGDAIQPSHPLSSPSPPASNPPQHQGLFK